MEKPKNKTIYTALFGTFLCAIGVVMGQVHHPMSADPLPHKVDLDPGSRLGKSIPAFDLRVKKEMHLTDAAQAALEAGDYASEEDYARQAVDLGVGSGLSNDLLAQSLKDQGKDDEALQAYRVIVVDQKDNNQDNLVPYAMLLLKAGQWAQATAVSNNVLPRIGNGETLIATSHFSPDVPQPKELATVLHIAQGLLYQEGQGWEHHSKREQGMSEFLQARNLIPNSDLTNYYVGYGWEHLDAQSRTKAANARQAKVALAKAATSKNSSIKKAADEAMKRMP